MIRQSVDKALQANKDHQYALKVYTERLEAELASVDKLIASAEFYEDSNDEALGIVSIPGAKKPVPLVPLGSFLSENSPFYEDASRRQTFEEYTTINTLRPKELELLAEIVRSENKRLFALEAQKSGQPVTDVLPAQAPSHWEQNTEGLDWKRIAMKFSSTSNAPSRSPTELRVRWLGHAHPKFSHSPWTPEETERLKQIVSELENGIASETKARIDWVKVAELLGTNRTPLDCMRHGITRRMHVWTPESDAKLLDAVKIHGGNNWSLVALAVSPDATAHACQKRYNDTLDPTLKRGPWSADEDTKLLRAIAGFWQPMTSSGVSTSVNNDDTARDGTEDAPCAGPSGESRQLSNTKSKTTGIPIPWPDVAMFVPGRNNNQCRERYNVLISSSSAKKNKDNATPSTSSTKGRPKAKINLPRSGTSTPQETEKRDNQVQFVNRSRWTADEDERLKRAVEELSVEAGKGMWDEVSVRVGGGRGATVCKKRLGKLKKLDSIPQGVNKASFRVNIGGSPNLVHAPTSVLAAATPTTATSTEPNTIPEGGPVEDTSEQDLNNSGTELTFVGAPSKRTGRTKGTSKSKANTAEETTAPTKLRLGSTGKGKATSAHPVRSITPSSMDQSLGENSRSSLKSVVPADKSARSARSKQTIKGPSLCRTSVTQGVESDSTETEAEGEPRSAGSDKDIPTENISLTITRAPAKRKRGKGKEKAIECQEEGQGEGENDAEDRQQNKKRKVSQRLVNQKSNSTRRMEQLIQERVDKSMEGQSSTNKDGPLDLPSHGDEAPTSPSVQVGRRRSARIAKK